MQQSEKSFNFGEEISKAKETQKRQRQTIPPELLAEYPFDRNDPNQIFYRVSQRITEQGYNQYLMLKLGWKIVTLKREQQDIALFCFGLLQSQITFPLRIYTIIRSQINAGRQENSNQLWMETQIMITPMSHQQGYDNMQLSLFRLCQEVLQLLRNFIEHYFNWSYMISENFEDSKVVELFEKQVIKIVKNLIKNRNFLGKE